MVDHERVDFNEPLEVPSSTVLYFFAPLTKILKELNQTLLKALIILGTSLTLENLKKKQTFFL